MDTPKEQHSSENRVIANSPQEVYAGGALFQIDPKELLGNELAIRQLINDRNTLSSKIDSKNTRIEDLNRQVENAKTPPLLTLCSTASAIIGGIFLNNAKSIFENQNYNNFQCWIPLIGGIILSVTAAIMINPTIRNWVPKRKNEI
ncbi:MAG: hypothetical protein U0264_11140 [Candidatus Kapaibacterium sp.]